MLNRILVAVADSPPALAAARLAIELGHAPSTELNFVTVAEADHDPDIILDHIASLAAGVGLRSTFTVIRDGEHPFEQLLDAARAWNDDLVVMGRADKRRPGAPYVGSQTDHLL